MFKFLGFTITLVLGLFCLIQAQPTPSFVGNWTASGEGTVLTFELEPNGRALMTIITDGQQESYGANEQLYSKTEIYGTATSLDPLITNTIDFWARYKIEGNTLIIEEDEGAISTTFLLDGKRVMFFQGICYHEVEWITESLEQQTEELGN